MAPVADDSFFPPLDRCLAGDARLISWRTAWRALCDEPSAEFNSNLEHFFNDNDTVALLSKPLDPYPLPSQKSSSEFDTRTAPINVSPNNNEYYNLDEIKADAKWLSKEVQVDEVVALRMAVIEWQERPADQLLSTALNPPSALTSYNGNGDSALAKDSLRLASPTREIVARPALDFSSENVRRKRLLRVYLSEKNHLLKLGTDLVSRAAVKPTRVQYKPLGSQLDHSRKNWIDELATKLYDAVCGNKDRTKQDSFCVQCIDAIGSVLDRTHDKSHWPQSCQTDLDQVQDYIIAQYTELITLLRLLLAILYSSNGVSTATSVKKWFSVVDAWGYLQEGKTVFADCTTGQLLVSVVSLEILKLEHVISHILQAISLEDSSHNPLATAAYIKNDDCISHVSTSFSWAAQSHFTCAAPAMYAWSIIATVLEQIAGAQQGSREARGSITSLDRRGEGRRPRDFRSEIENLYHEVIVVRDWEAGGQNTPRTFMSTAVDMMGVYNLIAVLSGAADTSFGSDVESATALMCKEALLDLIREGLDYVSYDEPVLDAILSILTPGESYMSSEEHRNILAAKLYQDHERFRPQIIDHALHRYPYELSFLLRVFTALANVTDENGDLAQLPEIATKLDTMPSYTQEAPLKFKDFVLQREELDANEIQLTIELPIFVRNDELWKVQDESRRLPRRALPSNEPNSSGPEPWREFYVAAGTEGRVIKESRPYVIHLRHQHSALEYLGLLLSSFTPNGDVVPAASRAQLDRTTAAEIVRLFTALLSASLEQESSNDAAALLLVRLSAALRNEQDIVTVISEALESELLAHLDQVAHEGSLELVTACIQFLDGLTKIAPERVWSILARSSLLGVQDGAVSLASVVGGTEILIGRYRFLDACTRLHASLVEDALAGLVKRKVVAGKTTHRFAQQESNLDATPDRTMSAVLNSYQKILVDVLQNIPDWKFNIREERCKIATNILDALSKLLKSTYGVEVAKEPSRRLTNVLGPAAEALLNTCAPQSGSSTLITTLARLLPECLEVAEDAMPAHVRGLLIDQTKSALEFLTLVLRAAKHGIDLAGASSRTLQIEAAASRAQTITSKHEAAEQRARSLASDLVGHFRTLASILASDHSLKAETFPLLSEIVTVLGSGDGDPPSILAQLDTDSQKAFLQATTQLDRPLCDVQIERRIWDFLAAVMSSRQNFFATFLLTGELPKKRAADRGAGNTRTKSILNYVLDQLSSIAILPPERANGMLKLVATAQQIWVWTNTEIRTHRDFLKSMLAWIDGLGVAPRDPSPGASIIYAKECEMASYLCKILAISLHAGLETGDTTVLKSLIPKLTFLREHGVTVNAYNRSLHRNLAENFRRKFPQSDLSDFKRTATNPAPYGTEFFYDRDFASSVLSHDVSWHGGGKGRNQGFADEFARANANLSLLHAQTKLLKEWKTLAITICEFAGREPSSHLVLAQIAEKCLLANADPQLDEPGAADAMNERIELAFVLCCKVVSLNVQNTVAKDLLKAAWELVRTSPVDYDVATAPNDIQYYRELLQVLYLTIQPHSHVQKPNDARATDETKISYLAPETASILVGIVGKVVVPGFRALCANIHTDLSLALPTDFSLLTGLLQSVISTAGISSIYTLLSDIVADSSLVRSALSLYSWSDQLAETTGHDPVYGEVAIMFLLALSTIPPIAEQMALGGVLSQLSASNLSNYFRKPGGKGPFDEPQRMFVIWSEGFLPLCLNLLDAVGPPIAAEVAVFLNTFPEQLQRAEKALRNETPGPRKPMAGAVTLGLVAEANSLSMIAAILSSDVARGAAEGINAADIPALAYDSDVVKSLMEALSRPRNLSERLTAVNSLEDRWMKTSTSGGDSVLLQKALKEVNSMLACVARPES